MPDFTSKTVRLHSVTRDDGQASLDNMEEIYDEFNIPDATRLKLWELFSVLASDVLIRFGQLDPDIGFPEQNGHG